MAVGKTDGSTFIDRAVQWAKDGFEKVKAAVAEHTAGSGYAKAEKSASKHHSDASTLARAAAKFSEGREPLHGEYISMRPIITEERVQRIMLDHPEYRARLENALAEVEKFLAADKAEPIHGEYLRASFTGSEMQEMLRNDPKLQDRVNELMEKLDHDLKK